MTTGTITGQEPQGMHGGAASGAPTGGVMTRGGIITRGRVTAGAHGTVPE